MGAKKKEPRAITHSILNRVSGGAFADILLERELPGLGEADRSLATELTYGVLRWQLRLDWVIDSFSSIKTKKLETSVLNALRVGVYEAYFLTRIPGYASVNEAVKLVRPLGAKKAGFVNAVLRNAVSRKEEVIYPDPEKEPLKTISVLLSHPEWLVRRWAERYGLEEARRLCEADQEIPPAIIRVNTLINSREDLMKELKEEGFDARETAFSPVGIAVTGGKLKARDPRYYVQDEASQLIAYLVSPRPGEVILDACSAPGGKTTHMAQLMGNRGIIYALDKHPQRLLSLEETAERLKIKIVKAAAADVELGLPFRKEAFQKIDAVLLDTPCTGLGVLRRSPDIKWRRKEEDIARLSTLQKRLLENAASNLKKGGRLVYSACTLEPEETEDIVNSFLDSHPDFSLEDPSPYLPPPCKPLIDKKGFFRTYPHTHGLDGFFAARLKKTGGNS